MFKFSITAGLFEDWINTLEPVPEWYPLIYPEDLLQDEISTSSPALTPLVTPGKSNRTLLKCISAGYV